jgi:hypothetical protein
MMSIAVVTRLKQLVLVVFLLVPVASRAGNTKSFKLEFYNNEIEKNYAVIRAADRKALDPKSFVCELVNVFDPDVRYEVHKFDFTVKTNGAKRTYEGSVEAAFLGTLRQLNASADGSPTTVTVTKVYYWNHAKVEKSMGIDQYDYATISVR